jgi:Ca2+-binding RTX toxin-like protein
VFGGSGKDIAVGGSDDDYVRGGGGNDQVFGAEGNDLVYGDRGDDSVIGGSGNDRVFGGSGNDTLFGITPNFPQGLGQGEIDFLTGNTGKDTFALAGTVGGDTKSVFYNDGDISSAGINDYAVITDFQYNDTIQLIGEAKNYSLGVSPQALQSGTGIFFNDSTTQELIGIVADVLPENLS